MDKEDIALASDAQCFDNGSDRRVHGDESEKRDSLGYDICDAILDNAVRQNGQSIRRALIADQSTHFGVEMRLPSKVAGKILKWFDRVDRTPMAPVAKHGRTMDAVSVEEIGNDARDGERLR